MSHGEIAIWLATLVSGRKSGCDFSGRRNSYCDLSPGRALKILPDNLCAVWPNTMGGVWPWHRPGDMCCKMAVAAQDAILRTTVALVTATFAMGDTCSPASLGKFVTFDTPGVFAAVPLAQRSARLCWQSLTLDDHLSDDVRWGRSTFSMWPRMHLDVKACAMYASVHPQIVHQLPLRPITVLIAALESVRTIAGARDILKLAHRSDPRFGTAVLIVARRWPELLAEFLGGEEWTDEMCRLAVFNGGQRRFAPRWTEDLALEACRNQLVRFADLPRARQNDATLLEFAAHNHEVEVIIWCGRCTDVDMCGIVGGTCAGTTQGITLAAAVKARAIKIKDVPPELRTPAVHEAAHMRVIAARRKSQPNRQMSLADVPPEHRTERVIEALVEGGVSLAAVPRDRWTPEICAAQFDHDATVPFGHRYTIWAGNENTPFKDEVDYPAPAVTSEAQSGAVPFGDLPPEMQTPKSAAAWVCKRYFEYNFGRDHSVAASLERFAALPEEFKVLDVVAALVTTCWRQSEDLEEHEYFPIRDLGMLRAALAAVPCTAGLWTAEMFARACELAPCGISKMVTAVDHSVPDFVDVVGGLEVARAICAAGLAHNAFDLSYTPSELTTPDVCAKAARHSDLIQVPFCGISAEQLAMAGSEFAPDGECGCAGDMDYTYS
jgi:hypothetical protein